MFSSDTAYGDLKDLTRRTASDKIFCDKALNIAKNSKYDGYQAGLAPMVFKFLVKNPFCLEINLLLVVVLKRKISETKN